MKLLFNYREMVDLIVHLEFVFRVKLLLKDSESWWIFQLWEHEGWHIIVKLGHVFCFFYFQKAVF